jgi:hypothetical protein
MRAQSIIPLLIITCAQLWLAPANAEDSNAVGQAYTRQATDVARRVVLAQLVKHPERIHRMSMRFTFQLDKQCHPHNVKVVSNPQNRWAEETGHQAVAAAKFPPLPKSVIQQSGSDLASFDYKLDLNEPR